MYYLGVDLGGTNIKAALVSENGEIVKEDAAPTNLPRRGGAGCRHRCGLPRHSV